MSRARKILVACAAAFALATVGFSPLGDSWASSAPADVQAGDSWASSTPLDL
jgi:hypothetical protein